MYGPEDPEAEEPGAAAGKAAMLGVVWWYLGLIATVAIGGMVRSQNPREVPVVVIIVFGCVAWLPVALAFGAGRPRHAGRSPLVFFEATTIVRVTDLARFAAASPPSLRKILTWGRLMVGSEALTWDPTTETNRNVRAITMAWTEIDRVETASIAGRIDVVWVRLYNGKAMTFYLADRGELVPALVGRGVTIHR